MKFTTVLADPPWAFKTYSKKGMDRSAENHYVCMTLADIFAMPVQAHCETNAVLLLWVTIPFLAEGVHLVNQWGFKYKSKVEWVKLDEGTEKLQLGTGYRARAASECLLIATKGTIAAPPPSSRLPGVIFAPRQEHSRKPDEQYTYAEQYPAHYLELFARRTRPGWVSLGNEITGRDICDDLRLLPALVDPAPVKEKGLPAE